MSNILQKMLQKIKPGEETILEGYLNSPISYRCWDLQMDGYADIQIRKNQKVKLHTQGWRKNQIDTQTRNILTNDKIFLDYKEYEDYVEFIEN